MTDSHNKIHLHLISQTSGSIWEITKDLLPFFENEFIITKEWQNEFPTKREILFCHFLKPEMFLDPEIFDSFKTKILIQPIDGTKIKKDVVDMFNCFDLILTPGEAGKTIMEQNGIQVPIKIIPNYYKKNFLEKKIYSGIEKYIPKNKIIFYHESSFHPRKGIEVLYEGFIRAFADTEMAKDVVLIVKDLPYNGRTFSKIEDLKLDAIKLQKTYKNSPQILKFSSLLNEEELKTLWSYTSAYVSFAKIEGFGIPMLRMFLMNKPIIALNNPNSGYIDFLTQRNAYLVDCMQITAVDEFMWLYEKETEWGIPNMGDVIQEFRNCYNDLKNPSGFLKTMKSDSNFYESLAYFETYALNTIANSYIDHIKEAHIANLPTL